MARSRKKVKTTGWGARAALFVNIGLLLLIALLLGLAAVHANTVYVRRAEVFLTDLPQEFDGTTLLYAADIDLCGANTPEKSVALFRQLQSLSPDLLLLGGDYTSPSLYDRLNRREEDADYQSQQIAAREAFFLGLSDFIAPLGKYAIASPEDAAPELLAQTLRNSGFRALLNGTAKVERNGAVIDLVGISTEDAMHGIAIATYRRGDCVVAMPYGPSLIPRLMTAEASDSGAWVDLILTGHTHGGQIKLFGHNVLRLNAQEAAYREGWFVESYVPILTTTGIGCEGANLRIGSSAEVWLITLRRKTP